MPGGYDAASPIRRPRAFARALGALAPEQAGPQGRTVLLRSTVDGEAFSTAHRSQTVYHGPVVYSDDPYRRLEQASSDLKLLLLLVFLKDAARRGQREYRFSFARSRSPARTGRTSRSRRRWSRPCRRRGGTRTAAASCRPAWRSLPPSRRYTTPGTRTALHVEALPAFVASGNPTVAPRDYDVETLPSDLRETVLIYPAVEALRGAVGGADAGCRKDAVAAARHAEPVVRFLCSTFGDRTAGVG